MAPNPILIPRIHQSSPIKQDRPFGIFRPLQFGACVALLLALFSWPWRWLISGAPVQTLLVLLGASQGARILPLLPLWTIISTLNLAYAVASTSWLLYACFIAGCYPAIFITCLFQFNIVAELVRRRLRFLLTRVHFVNDTIALFDIPALEIDTDVDGLMVIRGLTFSLSSLTLIAYGVEVGIKLSNDMELALQTEKVTISLFRRIDIGDVYANIKGGEYEMTFANMDIPKTTNADGEPLMIADSALLKVAAATGDTSRPPLVKMVSKMTDGAEIEDVSAKSGLKSMTKVSPDSEAAGREYRNTLSWIHKTNLIYQCREKVLHARKDSPGDITPSEEKDVRVGISTRLHSKPSVPHPPAAGIKVTTLQKLSPPRVRSLLHRMPMLLRLLLNPISYFHPVEIKAIVAAGSGKWITSQLQSHIFQDYADESAELRRLEQRMLAWLSDANFVLQLDDVTGLGQVSFLTIYDIVCYLRIADVMAYRSQIGDDVALKQVVRLGGADATFSIPSFLLPHHEHLLPPLPTKQDELKIKEEIEQAEGMPKTIRKEIELEQTKKDEANVKLSVHGSLPAVFDQELLNFIAALAKATKVIELEKGPSPMDDEVSGIKDFAKSLNRSMKDGMKKAMVDGVVNDRWIAKLVGKVTAKLETVQGDIGYSGDIPVALAPYRLPEGHIEARKLLG